MENKGEEGIEFRLTHVQLKNIDKETAKFLFEHGEKLLKETLDANNLIVSRTTSLLTIIVGLMVGLMGFSVNRIEKVGIDPLSETGIIGFF